MADKNTYKFYMSRWINAEWEAVASLEDYFDGLRYAECQGLSKYGKIKNIYTETYAETDELRTYIPDPDGIARENTDIEFVFVFIGNNRRDVYDNFVNWLSGYKIKYWDDCRNREVEMILIEAVEPSDDELYGMTPFMRATFKFKNLKGQTVKHT